MVLPDAAVHVDTSAFPTIRVSSSAPAAWVYLSSALGQPDWNAFFVRPGEDVLLHWIGARDDAVLVQHAAAFFDRNRHPF